MPILLEYLFAYPKSGGGLEIEIFQHAYASWNYTISHSVTVRVRAPKTEEQIDLTRPSVR